jgi:protease I
MTTILRNFLLLTILAASNQGLAKPARVLIVLNEGYRPEEYFQPRLAFEQAGLAVKVAARYGDAIRPSRPHWAEVPVVHPDLTFTQAHARDYDAVIFVGGNGAWNDLLPNPEVHRLLLEAVTAGNITGLICAATGLLATANNLDGTHPHFAGRHATGYFEVEGLLRRVGLINYDAGKAGEAYVVRDGNLITGRDPQSADLFGQTIVAALAERKASMDRHPQEALVSSATN